MVKVQIIIFNGFVELDAIAPFEVLQKAKVIGANVQTQLVTLADSAIITAAYGLQVQPAAKLTIEQRPVAETTIFRFKTTFGSNLRSRRFENQKAELSIKCAALTSFAAPKVSAGFKLQNRRAIELKLNLGFPQSQSSRFCYSCNKAYEICHSLYAGTTTRSGY